MVPLRQGKWPGTGQPPGSQQADEAARNPTAPATESGETIRYPPEARQSRPWERPDPQGRGPSRHSGSTVGRGGQEHEWTVSRHRGPLAVQILICMTAAPPAARLARVPLPVARPPHHERLRRCEPPPLRRIKPADFLPGEGKTTRITLPGEACLSFVTTLESGSVSPRLRALMITELPGQGMVRGLSPLLPGAASAREVLRRPDQCGGTFAQRKRTPGPDRSGFRRTRSSAGTCPKPCCKTGTRGHFAWIIFAQCLGNSHVMLKRSCRRESGMTVFECLRDLRWNAPPI